MRTVGAYEAKTHLARLLDQVAGGESITITRHGVPIAMLVPAPEAQRKNTEEILKAWREWQHRENITLGGLTIRELIEEGRRW